MTRPDGRKPVRLFYFQKPFFQKIIHLLEKLSIYSASMSLYLCKKTLIPDCDIKDILHAVIQNQSEYNRKDVRLAYVRRIPYLSLIIYIIRISKELFY